MSRKTLSVELSKEDAPGGRFYYANIDLPVGMKALLDDACQQARFQVDNLGYREITVTGCVDLPQLAEIRLDSPTLEELNYLAYRIGQLSEVERVAMQGVVKRCLDDGAFDGIVPIQDIINMTYGLDELNVRIGVGDDFSLGNFVLDNDLDDDLTGLTENVLDMLDMKQVGRRFREREGGIFIRNCYVSAGEYEFPAVFDGKNVPKDIYCEDGTVFRLKIGHHSAKRVGGTVERTEWIALPISREQADRISKEYDERTICSCMCYGMESAIPQISQDQFRSMLEFEKWNSLAAMIQAMSEEKLVRYKAVLALENPEDVTGLIDCAQHVGEYELDMLLNSENDYFREYLAKMLPKEFDPRWLNALYCMPEGEKLLGREKGMLTDYGVISGRGCHLYEMVPFVDNENQCEQVRDVLANDQKKGMSMI